MTIPAVQWSLRIPVQRRVALTSVGLSVFVVVGQSPAIGIPTPMLWLTITIGSVSQQAAATPLVGRYKSVLPWILCPVRARLGGAMVFKSSYSQKST